MNRNLWEYETNIKNKMVKINQGQSWVKFNLDPIGLKLGENDKPGCDGSMKRTLRMKLVGSFKVKVRLNFILSVLGSNLVKINLDMT